MPKPGIKALKAMGRRVLQPKIKGRPRLHDPLPASMLNAEPPAPIELVDTPIIDEAGRLTELTLPIQQMTERQFLAENASRHPGFNVFLQKHTRQELLLALSRDSSPKAGKFLKALLNPKNMESDVAVVAQRYGIGYNELMTVWRNDRLTEAMLTMFDGAPEVARHTVRDAQSSLICCPRCDGSGMMKIQRQEEELWVNCASCAGTGQVHKVGDRYARELVLETAGLTKSSKGANINVNTSINLSSVDSVLDEMDRVIDVDSKEVD